LFDTLVKKDRRDGKYYPENIFDGCHRYIVKSHVLEQLEDKVFIDVIIEKKIYSTAYNPSRHAFCIKKSGNGFSHNSNRRMVRTVIAVAQIKAYLQ
jgi:hypothetical protein